MNVVSTYLTVQVKLGSPEGPPTAGFSDGFAYWDGTSFAAAAVSGAVAAKIRPGRCDARQALAYIRDVPEGIRDVPEGDIRPFAKPGI